MAPREISRGYSYATKQGWRYRVFLVDAGIVSYRVTLGPFDLIGRDCRCHVVEFAERVIRRVRKERMLAGGL